MNETDGFFSWLVFSFVAICDFRSWLACEFVFFQRGEQRYILVVLYRV